MEPFSCGHVDRPICDGAANPEIRLAHCSPAGRTPERSGIGASHRRRLQSIHTGVAGRADSRSRGMPTRQSWQYPYVPDAIFASAASISSTVRSARSARTRQRSGSESAHGSSSKCSLMARRSSTSAAWRRDAAADRSAATRRAHSNSTSIVSVSSVKREPLIAITTSDRGQNKLHANEGLSRPRKGQRRRAQRAVMTTTLVRGYSPCTSRLPNR